MPTLEEILRQVVLTAGISGLIGSAIAITYGSSKKIKFIFVGITLTCFFTAFGIFIYSVIFPV